MSSSVVVLEDKFAAVRSSITSDILMDAAKAGGHEIEKYAKDNVSAGRPGLETQSGTLMNSINVTESKKSETFAEVGVGPSDVIYAEIHEFGGVIVPDTKQFLSWIDGKTGDRVFAKMVHIPARPYMRPAIDNNEESIQSVVEAKVWRNLDKAT